MIENILLDVDNLLVGIVYILASFVLFVIGKYAYAVIHKEVDVDEELVIKDNLAFSLSQIGYYVGLILIIGSNLMGESDGFMNDLINIFVYGFTGIVLMNLSVIINDKIILPKFSVRKEICDDRNAGVGAVEGAVAAGTGLLLMGVFQIEDATWVTMMIMFVVGQVLFIVSAKIYDMITPYNIHEHLEKDNVAVGVGLAGALIAMANIIRFGISNDIESTYHLLVILGFDIAVGLVMLPVIRLLVDKVILPKRSLTDEIINQEHPNVGAALIEAFAYIAGSMLIVWSL